MTIICWNKKQYEELATEQMQKAYFIAYAFDSKSKTNSGKVYFHIVKNRWGASDYNVTKTGLMNLLRKAL